MLEPRFRAAGRDPKRRAMVKYRGVRMAAFRASRIAQLEPLIQKANAQGMTIPKAAEWLGWSVSALRHWVRILKIRWRIKPNRKVFKLDRAGWEKVVNDGLKAGKSQAAIAKELGVGTWNISRFIKQQGIR